MDSREIELTVKDGEKVRINKYSIDCYREVSAGVTEVCAITSNGGKVVFSYYHVKESPEEIEKIIGEHFGKIFKKRKRGDNE